MNPRVIAISGPVKGTTFALGEGETLIGREGSSAVQINDPSVSRRHCLIRRESTELRNRNKDSTLQRGNLTNETNGPHEEQLSYKVVDLQSFNGTFVNGLPVNEQVLCDGDQITVGDVVLLFLLADVDEIPRPSTSPSEAVVITRSTVRLKQPKHCAR